MAKADIVAIMRAHAEAALAAPPWYTRPSAKSHFEYAKPTYIENWPADLCRMSIGQVDIPLTLDEAEAFGSNIVELGEGFAESPRGISGIVQRLDAAVAVFPRGGFVRLGSRSPKDAFYADLSIPVTSGEQAAANLLGGSERVCDDLHVAIANNYAPHIFVREWVVVPEWAEFRCFMVDRSLVGISQYYYRCNQQLYPELVKWRDSIEWAIRDQFFPVFRDSSHLDSVVFDVFVKVREKTTPAGVEVETQVKLLEINPFFEMTDPCLFDWRNPQGFDGSFRIVGATA